MEKLMRVIVGICGFAMYGSFHFEQKVLEPLVESLQPQTMNEQKGSKGQPDFFTYGEQSSIVSNSTNLEETAQSASDAKKISRSKQPAQAESQTTEQQKEEAVKFEQQQASRSVETAPLQSEQPPTDPTDEVNSETATAAETETSEQSATELAQPAASTSTESQSAEQTTEPPVEQVTTIEITEQQSAQQAQAEAQRQAEIAQQVEASQPNRIMINGTIIPLVDTQGAAAAPVGNVAGIWQGTGDVTDNAPTHIIGHNPGAFACTFGLTIGNQFSVTDRNSNQRNYTVYKIMEINDDAFGRDGVDYWDEIFYQPGESISLQACIDEYWNLVVLAH